jgi:hypothetical protein
VIQDTWRLVTVSRTSWSPASGGASTTASVTTRNEETWTAVSDQPWLVVGPPISSTETDLVLLARPNSTGATREATVTVTASGGSSATLTVSQKG